jgi:hypothetical protein
MPVGSPPRDDSVFAVAYEPALTMHRSIAHIRRRFQYSLSLTLTITGTLWDLGSLCRHNLPRKFANRWRILGLESDFSAKIA